ncbi:MAG: hypothetical protein H7A24_16505 [Leptospiraceae bacterium]|nr:hypothetical protein [Leptospiraceae bacterium]MCP5513491.1 hypothetical protein [Leptospiraceae bacterium]
MRDIEKQIEKMTGLSLEEAMSIDEVNLYDRLGEETFWKLSKLFYNKVYQDEEIWFRNIFKNRDIEDSIQNQVEFFIQRMGGPQYFSERKGHPALIARHMDFNMKEKAAERWLFHMKNSLEETPEIDDDSKHRMLNYFTHTAYFLSIGVTQHQNKKNKRNVRF